MKLLTLIALITLSTQAQAQVTRGGNPFPEMKNRLATCGMPNSYPQNGGMATIVICAASILLDGMEFIAMRGTSNTMPPMPPMQPPIQPTMPQQKLVVIYGNSDGCGGNPVANVVMSGDMAYDSAQCNNLQTKAERSWSISINGACVDINDTTALGACLVAMTTTPRR